MIYANKNLINIMKVFVMFVTAAVVSGLLTVAVAAQPEQAELSYRTSTVSITWGKDASADTGGGGGSGGGSSSGGGGSSSSGGGGRGVGGATLIIDGTLEQEIVSVPGPGTSLGRLPETGGNYLIPLTFTATGMVLLLAYVLSNKGKEPACVNAGIGT